MPVNLLDFDAERLAGFFAEIGEKPFRARQVMRWIHQFGQSEFESMSDLSKSLRAKSDPNYRWLVSDIDAVGRLRKQAHGQIRLILTQALQCLKPILSASCSSMAG